jgi:hypothetical protein
MACTSGDKQCCGGTADDLMGRLQQELDLPRILSPRDLLMAATVPGKTGA